MTSRATWCHNRATRWIAAVLGLVAAVGVCARVAVAATDEPADETLRSGSRAPYVHRLTLYDHDGAAISPDDPLAGPYSPARTCGKCHPYGTISSGWHFNAGEGSADDAGRPGEPWILVDEATHTVVPISLRRWPRTFTPEYEGPSRWAFALRFGHHWPGGGWLEVEGAALAQVDNGLRWGVSGPLQIDCLMCHATNQQHDPAEAERQIARENFRWLPTAAAGLAVVRGDAAKAPDDWDPMMPPNPDYPEQAGPQLTWDRSRFDPDDRVLFSLTGKPAAARCYFCHTVQPVGEAAEPDWQHDQDVHLAAGLTCVDCHRHGIDHHILRGYADGDRDETDEDAAETEAVAGPGPAALTCRGCHLGGDEETGEANARPGRLGAPRPEHRGLPPLHLEELACTACHSGPWPRLEPVRFQTSRAHGLGLASKERTDETPPAIWGPVFVRNQAGRIGPALMLWPSYWGAMGNGTAWPIPPAELLGVLPAEITSSAAPLTPEQIAAGLTALKAHDGDERLSAYVQDGWLFGLDEDGSVMKMAHPEAAAVTWPIAHDVRPAEQALGAGGCTDCHSTKAAFTFGAILPGGVEQAQRPPITHMYEVLGQSPLLMRTWATSFGLRWAFKLLGFACCAVLGLVLLRYGLDAVAAISRGCGSPTGGDEER